MTKSTHLKIPNCHTNCRAEIFEGSFKCLQGCSWRAVSAISEHSKPFEWLIMSPSDKIYSFKDSQLLHWLLDWNIWRIFQVSSRMQLTGSLSNLWALQTLWMTYHVSWWQNLLIWRFLHKLLSWNIWRILQMSSRMQLKGSSSNLWACGSNQTFFYEANSLRFCYLLFLYYPCDITTLKMWAHV